MELKNIIQALKNIRINFRSRNNTYIKYHIEFYTYMGEITDDEELLNKLWCLKSIFTIQNKYVESFNQFSIEKCSVILSFLHSLEISIICFY